MLNLCIYHKDVSFIIDKNITRHYIPNLVLTVPETAILSSLFEAEGSQIRCQSESLWLDGHWLFLAGR